MEVDEQPLQCCRDDGGWPSEVAFWEEASNHRTVRWPALNRVLVLFGLKAVEDVHRRGRLLVFGVTTRMRHLLVVLDEPTVSGTAYVVTARPITTRERREYRRLWND